MNFIVFEPNAEENQERLVQQVYLRERDLYDHQQTLTRYREILKDPDFV